MSADWTIQEPGGWFKHGRGTKLEREAQDPAKWPFLGRWTETDTGDRYVAVPMPWSGGVNVWVFDGGPSLIGTVTNLFRAPAPLGNDANPGTALAPILTKREALVRIGNIGAVSAVVHSKAGTYPVEDGAFNIPLQLAAPGGPSAAVLFDGEFDFAPGVPGIRLVTGVNAGFFEISIDGPNLPVTLPHPTAPGVFLDVANTGAFLHNGTTLQNARIWGNKLNSVLVQVPLFATANGDEVVVEVPACIEPIERFGLVGALDSQQVRVAFRGHAFTDNGGKSQLGVFSGAGVLFSRCTAMAVNGGWMTLGCVDKATMGFQLAPFFFTPPVDALVTFGDFSAGMHVNGGGVPPGFDPTTFFAFNHCFLAGLLTVSNAARATIGSGTVGFLDALHYENGFIQLDAAQLSSFADNGNPGRNSNGSRWIFTSGARFEPFASVDVAGATYDGTSGGPPAPGFLVADDAFVRPVADPSADSASGNTDQNGFSNLSGAHIVGGTMATCDTMTLTGTQGDFTVGAEPGAIGGQVDRVIGVAKSVNGAMVNVAPWQHPDECGATETVRINVTRTDHSASVGIILASSSRRALAAAPVIGATAPVSDTTPSGVFGDAPPLNAVSATMAVVGNTTVAQVTGAPGEDLEVVCVRELTVSGNTMLGHLWDEVRINAGGVGTLPGTYRNLVFDLFNPP